MNTTKIRLLPDNWTYEDYWKFVTAYRSGDNDTVFKQTTKLIASWDYPVDLNTKNAIMKLGVKESAEVIRTVMETIGKYLEDIDIEAVEVDFGSWDTEKFFLFDSWKQQGKFDKTEPLIYEVIKWAGLPPVGTAYTFTQEATAYKAITAAYMEIISGKN